MSILSPNYALESSIASYLTGSITTSGSLLSGSIFTTYTGIDNLDLATAPAVVIDASDSREIVPFTRNYEFNVKVYVKEIAADVPQLGVLAQLIFNEFVNTDISKVNFSNLNYNINIWSVITDGMRSSSNGDTLVNEFDCRCIGALVPS